MTNTSYEGQVRSNHKISDKDFRFFYHGTSSHVASFLRDGGVVDRTFHVTDDLEVAAKYAGPKGSVLVVVATQEGGVQSRISLCDNASVNGANQWVMTAEQANDWIEEAKNVFSSSWSVVSSFS